MMSLQEECDKIRKAVYSNDITTLKEMITCGVDVNHASVNKVSAVV